MKSTACDVVGQVPEDRALGNVAPPLLCLTALLQHFTALSFKGIDPCSHTHIPPSSDNFGCSTQRLETQVHPKTCTRKFIAGLFVTTQSWKPPKCPSVGELWYVQPLEDSSVIKKERKDGCANSLDGSQGNYAELKTPSCRRLHAVILFIWDALDITKLQRWGTDY